MKILVLTALFGAGVTTAYRRWMWGIVVAVAIGVAAWNWTRGAYSDSGNEFGFSMIVIVLVFVPAVGGAFVGQLARRRYIADP